MRAFAITLATAGCLTAPAQADWQFTTWGQSQSDLLSLTDKGVSKTTTKEEADWQIETIGDALAKAPYKAADIDTTAVFLFKKHALAGVNLQIATSSEAGQIRTLLSQQYGKPISEKSSMPMDCASASVKWRDEAAGNVVEYHSYECIGGTFFGNVLYLPIASAAKTGL